MDFKIATLQARTHTEVVKMGRRRNRLPDPQEGDTRGRETGCSGETLVFLTLRLR